MRRTCFLFGNRDASQALFPVICAAVEEAVVGCDVEVFVVGGRGRFDRLAAQAVRMLRSRYPYIRLCLLLSYHPAERAVILPPGFDECLYPLEKPVPPKWAISHANRHMIAHSDVCIAYAACPGCARRLLAYAQNRAKAGLLKLVDLSAFQADGACVPSTPCVPSCSHPPTRSC